MLCLNERRNDLVRVSQAFDLFFYAQNTGSSSVSFLNHGRLCCLNDQRSFLLVVAVPVGFAAKGTAYALPSLSHGFPSVRPFQLPGGALVFSGRPSFLTISKAFDAASEGREATSDEREKSRQSQDTCDDFE